MPPRQRPAPSRATLLARVAFAGVAVYVAIDVLLAFLRPGYSLLYNAESDYGRGPWYWVMDLNFLLRCALSLAIATALYRTVRLGGRTRAGLALLVTWAICSGLLAFFADDPAPARSTAAASSTMSWASSRSPPSRSAPS
jgi:hypothetical membrane protein